MLVILERSNLDIFQPDLLFHFLFAMGVCNSNRLALRPVRLAGG
jgi:hypothetical protein